MAMVSNKWPLTKSVITRVHQSPVSHSFEMVYYKNMWITPGHPLYVIHNTNNINTWNSNNKNDNSNGRESGCYDWYRPDEMSSIILRDPLPNGVYNLTLSGNEHTILVRAPILSSVSSSISSSSIMSPSSSMSSLWETTTSSNSSEGVIACTIGRDCGQRLRALHPHNDAKYGPTANAANQHSSNLSN
jgi:hypothetical protein